MSAPRNLLCRAVAFEPTVVSGRAASSPGGDGRTLEGYGAVFGTATRIENWEGKFDEVIARGAFTQTLKARTPVVQFDHGRDPATGTVPIGAIEELREDGHGLFLRALLHDNPRVEPLRQAIASGAVDGMSFRFRVVRDEWNDSGDVPLRTIKEVELFEVGPVVFPAYESTTVGVRTLLADLDVDEQRRLLSGLQAVPPAGPYATPAQRDAFFRNLDLYRLGHVA